MTRPKRLRNTCLKWAGDYSEIANISGRNRQTVRLWAQQLNAETARQDHLEKFGARHCADHEILFALLFATVTADKRQLSSA